MLRSTILVTLLSLLGNVISLLNQLVLARYFGAGPDLDAYLVGISIPLTVCSLIAGVLGYQLVPALQRANTTTESSDGLLGALVFGMGGALFILAILGSAFAGLIVKKMLPGANWTEAPVIISVARISWLWLPLAILGAIYTAALHLRQRFFVATLFQSLPMLGALCGCLIAHNRIGVKALAWGQLSGYFAMVVGLRVALQVIPSRHFDWVGLCRLLKEMPGALAALLIFFIYPFSDAIWGTHAGPAGVSHLGYAQRLLVGFAGLTVVGATTVLFPRLAQQAATGDGSALRLALSKGLRAILTVVTPAAVLLSVLALPILQLMFERGAFRLTDSIALSRLLPPMLAGMVAMSCAVLVFKALFAQGAIRVAASLGICGATVYFALSGLLVGPFGLPGIGVSYAIAWLLPLILGIRQIWRFASFKEVRVADKSFLFHLLVSSALVGVICWIGTSFLPSPLSPDWTRRFTVISVTSLGAIVTYLVVGNSFLATAELREITRHVREMITPK